MAKYRVAFAAKAKDIGKLVEMAEREAAELVKFGRLVRVPDEPAAAAAEAPKPADVAKPADKPK